MPMGEDVQGLLDSPPMDAAMPTCEPPYVPMEEDEPELMPPDGAADLEPAEGSGQEDVEGGAHSAR